MRYVVLGGHGMLGHDLARALEGRDFTALGRDQADLTDPAALRAAVAGADVVINAAAYTRVDDAETDEAAATAINGTGAGDAARAAAEVGARFVQVSTDYVFDGSATTPYAEDTPRAPVSAYGRSKGEGERLVAQSHPAPHIVRTAWLYGENGPCFPRTMLTLAAGRETVDVVADQVGQPTWTRDLAYGIVGLLDAETPAGIYHATNAGSASWFDFARATFELSGLDPDRVHPIDSAAFVRPAPRPAYSVLGHDAWLAAGLSELRPWREALADAVARGAVSPR
ncbi:MAG: dTDP-4-dehydrorhamnose reductase [Pseudolysinimonas sp.]